MWKIVRFLGRLFTSSEGRGSYNEAVMAEEEKTPGKPKVVDKDLSYPSPNHQNAGNAGTERPSVSYSSADMYAIKESAERVSNVIRESMEIAAKSKNVETKRSRIDVAKEALAQLKIYQEKFSFLKLTGVEGVERDLQSLEESLNASPEQKEVSEEKSKGSYKALNTEGTLNYEDLLIKKDSEVEAFWSKLKEGLNGGEFWADKIKEYSHRPRERLLFALQYLPLPAAFREAAVALRTIIREKRKENEDYQEELSVLYKLAAIESFGIPYSEYLKQPGYNVMEIIPPHILARLSFRYEELGVEQLKLLKKTDKKWMAEQWGSPKSHTTLNALYQDVWKEYERKLKERQERKLQKLLGRI